MAKAANQPVVMTIAGFDPSGGAGVLADIKTISAFGCYGVAAVTSLTFQNTRRVFGARHQSAADVGLQITTLLDDFDISAIKTGMLPTPEIIEEVASIIRSRAIPVIVVDPVLESTSGFALSDDAAADALRRCLFPLASLVTPNVVEAHRLTGVDVWSARGKERAAEHILEMSARAVLITGGDEESDTSTDLLLDTEGSAVFSTERVRSKDTHGTGCTFASAMACLLARGHTLREAVPTAKRYIHQALLGAQGLGHGHGPLNHSPSRFKLES